MKLEKLHRIIAHKKHKIDSLRKRIDSTPIDPRSGELQQELRNINKQIEKYNDELEILRKQNKSQSDMIKKTGDNPQLDERLESTKKEMTEVKQVVKQQDKEAKDIALKSQNQVIFLYLMILRQMN